jgi:hypothetical protein
LLQPDFLTPSSLVFSEAKPRTAQLLYLNSVSQTPLPKFRHLISAALFFFSAWKNPFFISP